MVFFIVGTSQLSASNSRISENLEIPRQQCFEILQVFPVSRVKILIAWASKHREIWELFVPQASCFDGTLDIFNEIQFRGIGWKVKNSMSGVSAISITDRLRW